MVFDLDFVRLELLAAQQGTVPPALPNSPVFQAITFHEQQMNRPRLDAGSFQANLAAAAAGNENSWGLSGLFQRREKIEQCLVWLEKNQDFISQVITRWLSIFTTTPIKSDLRCILYAGTYDGGFKLGDSIYLNLLAFSCKEAFYETLAHESFHARLRSPLAEERIQQLEDSSDYLGGVLYFTFEEGIAEFIGYNGFTATKYPILRLRSPQEGAEELRQLLERYSSGTLSGQEMYRLFRSGDCCYTAGVTIANAIWESQGRDGLDLWSIHCDGRSFYKAFRTTPQGADWPDLGL